VESVIRPAAALDAVAIVKLLKKGYGERLLPYQQVNDGLAVELMLRLILTGFTLVAERGGRIVGVHANFVHAGEEWSATKFVDNAFFYVVPAERKHGTAKRLKDLVERNADGAGLYIRQGTFADEDREDSLMRMLKMDGYQYIGAYMVRAPRNVKSATVNTDPNDASNVA
jgi:GNAT superfamily N-acetyltransferase